MMAMVWNDWLMMMVMMVVVVLLFLWLMVMVMNSDHFCVTVVMNKLWHVDSEVITVKL